MADYQKMYMTLFNAITDVIGILQKAQQVTEELYISEAQPHIMVLEILEADNNSEDKT